MRLKNPGTAQQAIDALRSLESQAGNALNAHSAAELQDQYLKWTENADIQFSNLFRQSALADGLHSAAYWEIRRLRPEQDPRPYPLIQREIGVQRQRLEEAIDGLIRLKAFVDRPGVITVLDTSALIEGEYFDQHDWPGALGGEVRLVVPILVVEELDRIKDRGRDSRPKKRARSVVKRLRDLVRSVPAGQPASWDRLGVTVEVWLDDDHQSRHPINDVEILQQAQALQNLTGKRVVVACTDAAMEFRARQEGLHVYEVPRPSENSEPCDGQLAGVGGETV